MAASAFSNALRPGWVDTPFNAPFHAQMGAGKLKPTSKGAWPLGASRKSPRRCFGVRPVLIHDGQILVADERNGDSVLRS